MRKAIFLDKDGTLIYDVPYNADPEKIFLQEKLVHGLRKLQAAGYLLVVVTNQAGVAHGHFPEHHLKGVRAKIESLLYEQGIVLDGFYYCPHHPEGRMVQYAYACECRKPLPGLFLQAAREMNIDLGNSWALGDILNDVEAGNRAGCSTILINNGNETEWHTTGYGRTPDHITRSINEAASIILQPEGFHITENRWDRPSMYL
ncbi:HAD family hydrolase [Chitinophaga parva]|uniref:D,D-heptose 1,7-bisphosphate phosphatase n=1 Tax=Chitinophaga parva TaxID=2169414 RepID=A0A2T7BHE4_9BACT|nr:HAD family hydrolase [Chitinophaga parva]PUZ25698.1 HAD family hydrolase [Chitinophaga parva]